MFKIMFLKGYKYRKTRFVKFNVNVSSARTQYSHVTTRGQQRLQLLITELRASVLFLSLVLLISISALYQVQQGAIWNSALSSPLPLSKNMFVCLNCLGCLNYFIAVVPKYHCHENCAFYACCHSSLIPWTACFAPFRTKNKTWVYACSSSQNNF